MMADIFNSQLNMTPVGLIPIIGGSAMPTPALPGQTLLTAPPVNFVAPPMQNGVSSNLHVAPPSQPALPVSSSNSNSHAYNGSVGGARTNSSPLLPTQPNEKLTLSHQLKELLMQNGLGQLNGALPLLLEDYLEEVSLEGEEAEEVLELVHSSYHDNEYTSDWKPVRIELIKNKTLHSEYDEKKQDFLIRGRQPHELQENLGFLVENNVATLETMTAVGLQTHETDYNPLGYGRLGVYVCRHADICLEHALLKHSGTNILRLLVAKYITGRQTTAIPRMASASEFIEPTQGYDSHVSALPPGSQDSLQTQFDRSQVFLFEINKLLQPATRPRQVIPYAVVTYTENGIYNSAVDAKPTPKEKLAGNPRLQEIIKAINAKGSDSVSQGLGSPTGSSTPSSPGLHLPAGVTVSAATGQPGLHLPAGVTVSAATGQPVMATPTLRQGLTSLNNHANAVNSSSPPAMNPLVVNVGTPDLLHPDHEVNSGNPDLKHIISQINARLDKEVKDTGVVPSASRITGGGNIVANESILGTPPPSTGIGMQANGIQTTPSPRPELAKPGLAPLGVMSQRVGFLPDFNAVLKAAATPALSYAAPPSVYQTGMPPAALLTARHNLPTAHPAPGFELGFGGIPQGLPAFPQPHALSGLPTGGASLPGQTFYDPHSRLAAAYQPSVSSPAPFVAPSLAYPAHMSPVSSYLNASNMHHLALRSSAVSLKRPLQDPSATIDYDKRPKLI